MGPLLPQGSPAFALRMFNPRAMTSCIMTSARASLLRHLEKTSFYENDVVYSGSSVTFVRFDGLEERCWRCKVNPELVIVLKNQEKK